MGPLQPTTVNGNRYVAIAVCAFSKYVEAQGKYFEKKKSYFLAGLKIISAKKKRKIGAKSNTDPN